MLQRTVRSFRTQGKNFKTRNFYPNPYTSSLQAHTSLARQFSIKKDKSKYQKLKKKRNRNKYDKTIPTIENTISQVTKQAKDQNQQNQQNKKNENTGIFPL